MKLAKHLNIQNLFHRDRKQFGKGTFGKCMSTGSVELDDLLRITIGRIECRTHPRTYFYWDSTRPFIQPYAVSASSTCAFFFWRARNYSKELAANEIPIGAAGSPSDGSHQKRWAVKKQAKVWLPRSIPIFCYCQEIEDRASLKNSNQGVPPWKWVVVPSGRDSFVGCSGDEKHGLKCHNDPRTDYRLQSISKPYLRIMKKNGNSASLKKEPIRVWGNDPVLALHAILFQRHFQERKVIFTKNRFVSHKAQAKK